MSLKNSITKADPIDWDSLQNLLLKLERDGEHRTMLLIASGCYLGLRVSDLIRLKWEDLLDRVELEIIEKKTGKIRKIGLNTHLIEIAQRVYENEGLDRLIFESRITGSGISTQRVNQILKEVAKKYKLKGRITSHSMRKTFGKRIFESHNHSERALVILSQMFNHSSTAITRRYIGIVDKEISDIYLSL